MTIHSVTCFSHGGTAQINIGKNSSGSSIINGNLTCNGTPSSSFSNNALNLGETFDFIMVGANGANRVTVTIKTTLNQ